MTLAQESLAILNCLQLDFLQKQQAKACRDLLDADQLQTADLEAIRRFMTNTNGDGSRKALRETHNVFSIVSHKRLKYFSKISLAYLFSKQIVR